MRAIKNLGDLKASKTAIFEIEKREGKKPMPKGVRRITQGELT